MIFGDWIDFCNRKCSASDCDRMLVDDHPEPLVFEDGMFYHEECLLRAKRAFAAAMYLARLGRAIAEYVYYRDNSTS